MGRLKTNVFLNPVLASDGADSYRYIYQLGLTDQTVTCFDTSSHTVVATITLTAAKAILNIQYSSRNKSFYCFGNAWYDRIDGNPASGTFNTVVQSGAFTSNSNATSMTYSPTFHAFICANGELFFIASDHSISLAVAANNRWPFVFKRIKVNNGRDLLSQTTLSQAAGPLKQMFKSGLLLAPIQNSGSSFSLFQLRNYEGNFCLYDVSLQNSISLIGNTNKIGSYLFIGRVLAGAYGIVDLETGLIGTTWALSPTDRATAKFTPVGGNAGRIFVYQRVNTNVNLSVIDWATKADLGDISRAAYKATDENCTRQGIYCPYDKCFYVLGGNSSSTGTVNLLHRYDPTQVLASMYVASYTVGNNATATAYTENTLAMNGIEQYEYEDKDY